MAEAVFAHLASAHPHRAALLAAVDSAGTGAYHAASPPDSRTLSVLAQHGVRGYAHAARKVGASDFARFEYVLAMDEENRRFLQRARDRIVAKAEAKGGEGAAGELGRVMLFGEFGGLGKEEVVDPYYGARDGFEVAYEQVVRFSEGLLRHLEVERGLGDGEKKDKKKGKKGYDEDEGEEDVGRSNA